MKHFVKYIIPLIIVTIFFLLGLFYLAQINTILTIISTFIALAICMIYIYFVIFLITEYRYLESLITTTSDLITDGIVITNHKNKIVYVNQTLLDITGYKKEDLLGQNPRIFKGKQESDAFYREFWEKLKRDGRFECDIWDKKKDGTLFLKHLNLRTIKDKRGIIRYYISVHKNIRTLNHKNDVNTNITGRLQLNEILKKYENNQNIDFYFFFGNVVNRLLVDKQYKKDTYKKAINVFTNRIFKTFGQDCVVAEYDFETLVLIIPKHYGKRFEIIDIVLNLSKGIRLDVGLINLEIKYGVISFPNDTKDSKTLLLNAHTALNNMLKRPGAKVGIFNQEEVVSNEREMAILSALKEAVENNHFTVHYQPQIHAKTNKVEGIEALIRWHHSTLGIIHPNEFIPIAEWHGYIDQVTYNVVKNVIQDIKHIHEIYPRLPISINISSLLLKQKHLLNKSINLIKHSSIRFEYIEFELTENIFIDAKEKILDYMYELKQLGLSLALDDFGTGYSSFKYLREMPLDKLKFDRSFITNCNNDEVSYIQAFVAIAKGLNMKMVAEGVETKDELECIIDQGCNVIQGFYYSKPLPLKNLLDYLEEYKKNNYVSQI